MTTSTDNFYQSDAVNFEKVIFKNQLQMNVVGNLFTPKNAEKGANLPALVIGHPMGAVKEQSATLYATKLAELGFVTLAVDLSFWGESDGEPRNTVLPDLYAESFSAGVDYLASRSYVNKESIGGLGVCGSGGFIISAAKIDPRIKAVATVSMYDMGGATRNGLGNSIDLDMRKDMLDEASEQRNVEYLGGEVQYTGGCPHHIDESSHPIAKEFYDFYRTERGEYTPERLSADLTTHPTLSSNVRFMNFYPFNDIETISPRPLLFVAGEHAHSFEFSQQAYDLAAEPKQLLVVPNAGHVDLYDDVGLIPFTKIAEFFTASL